MVLARASMTEIDLGNVSPKISANVERYTRFLSVANLMFGELSLRTTDEPWRMDGVGSCTVSESFINQSIDLDEPAGPTFIRVIRQVNRSTAGVTRDDACAYHREDVGCILREFKPPVCISWVDNKKELKARFGIDGDKLQDDLYEIALRLASGAAEIRLEDDYFSIEEYTEAACEAVDKMTEHVKKFPVLH